ncbi:MAG: prolyl oligopeptidase family serine peptidase [Rhodoferax sp.]|nr:prolyl oligopeptidase family serine peptidase [Rhodoferax sp.]MCF8211022.1 prolyl oligopeptidase family serine peptidase [Rhodoferax sp.]
MMGVLLFATSGLSLAQAPTAPDKLPVAAFFEHSKLQGAFLSPSGHWLAVKAPGPEGRVALAVVDLEEKIPPRFVASLTDSDVNMVRWVNDEMLVFDVIDLKDGIDLRRGSGLFSTHRDGSLFRKLIRLEASRMSNRSLTSRDGLDVTHHLLSAYGPEPDEVIIGRYAYRVDTKAPDMVLPMRLNVRTGKTLSMAAGAPEHAMHWLFDAKGAARVVTAQHEGKSIVYWREGEQWKEIAQFDTINPTFTPRYVDLSGQLFVTVSEKEGARTSSLKRFDLKTLKPEDDPLVRTAGFDFAGGLVTTRNDRDTCGVRVVTDAETTVWYAPAMRAVQSQVDAALPGRINQIDTQSCNDPQVVLVKSYSDRIPGEFFIFRPVGKQWKSVGKAMAGIDPRSSATLDFHRFTTREGLDMPVWVTTPQPHFKGARPMLVLVHGGPFVRGGSWRWHPEAQFYASRGYVVIEPEFRGSRGYGFSHFQAGWKQWGQGMIDDIAQATRWAVEKANVNSKRVCIGGGSYGGYASLMSLARYPELYKCGIAWAAVTDLELLLTSQASDMGEEYRQYGAPRLVGDPVTDAAMLTANSPVNLAQQIKAPVLMAHGLEDRRVPPSHAYKMRSALKDAGNPPEWVEYANEGHGWIVNENRVDFWSRVEKFLAKNLE